MKICKKCDVEMNVKNVSSKRRGSKQKNIPVKYYCPKCSHSEYVQ